MLIFAASIVFLGAAFATIDALAASAPIPSELIRKNVRVRDADMMISARTLISTMKGAEKPLLIDIRPAAEFDALHIPGALNIALHFIRTKPHLKSSPLILVDQGLAFHRLAPACRELRKQGFDVRILDGGMHAWCMNKGPLVGQLVRQVGYSRINPADFFLEKDDPDRIICDISATRSPSSLKLMPYATHLPLAGDKNQRRTRLEKFKAVSARDGAATIILVDDQGDDYANVRTVFNRAGYQNVFYLTGGIDAYRTYLEGLSRSWLPRNKRMVTYSPCSVCPDSKKQ